MADTRVALRSLRYMIVDNQRYAPGDRMNVSPEKAKALLDAGSAIFYEANAPKVRARPVTAQAGLPGRASDGDPDALVGKLPKRSRRKKS